MILDLCSDLLAERVELTGLLEPLEEEGWRAPTAAPGWTILDQVTHIAYFDEAARTAIVEPETFLEMRDEASGDVDAYVDKVMRAQRHLLGSDALPWLEHAGRLDWSGGEAAEGPHEYLHQLRGRYRDFNFY